MIRRAEYADLAAIIELRREWTREEHGDIADPDFEENLTAWFGREWSRRIMWLAEEGGRPVGMMNLAIYERMPRPGRALSRWGYLGNVFVLTAYWLRRDRVRPDPGLLHCTFCGKDQKRVKKLIAGPSVYICDGCTGLAKVVISDGQPVTTEIAELTAGSEDQPRTQCSFCGKRRDQTACLVMSSAQTGRNTAATICNECLDLCTEIITEELADEQP